MFVKFLAKLMSHEVFKTLLYNVHRRVICFGEPYRFRFILVMSSPPVFQLTGATMPTGSLPRWSASIP